MESRSRERVERKGSNTKSLGPIGKGKVSMEEKGTYFVRESPDEALSMTVLLSGVGTRETRNNTRTTKE